jgi:hypothetical protein
MQEAFYKTIRIIRIALPTIVGVLLFVSILSPLFQKYYPLIFTGNYILDPLIGAVAGSISFGIPIVSYVTGGELIARGVSLLAVTAFIISWSSVGIMMLPLEISNLGRKFAIVRNSLNFAASIIIAILTVLTIDILR